MSDKKAAMPRTSHSGLGEISQRRRALKGRVELMANSLAESNKQEKLQHQQFHASGKRRHTKEEHDKELARETKDAKKPTHINAAKNVSRGHFHI